jgi:hypothetical protein
MLGSGGEVCKITGRDPLVPRLRLRIQKKNPPGELCRRVSVDLMAGVAVRDTNRRRL